MVKILRYAGADTAQNLRGAKLIFHELYVYIFAALEKFPAHMSACCLYNSKKLKNRPFFARTCDKKGGFF